MVSTRGSCVTLVVRSVDPVVFFVCFSARYDSVPRVFVASVYGAALCHLCCSIFELWCVGVCYLFASVHGAALCGL